MGVKGLWDVLRPAGEARSLLNISITEGFVPNHSGKRGYRVGIDASIWFFHASTWVKSASQGENPEIRTLMFRLAKLATMPILPLIVFDGPERPTWKRGKKINTKGVSWLQHEMQRVIETFGFEWRQAPGEAEAELAYLNRIGVIDAVLSDDADNFLFGAQVVLRNMNNTKNAAGKKDENRTHVNVYDARAMQQDPTIGLTRGGYILIGLVSGGDYHEAGIPGIGPRTALGLAQAGLGDTLIEVVSRCAPGSPQMNEFLHNWRESVRYEIRCDPRKLLGRKSPSMANKIPNNFPDINVVFSYLTPITSESKAISGRGPSEEAIIADYRENRWRKEMNLKAIARYCEIHFEWGVKEVIIQRMRTILWPAVCMRVLRRSVLETDEKKAFEPRSVIPATPKQHGRPEWEIGTPSGLISRYFERMVEESPLQAKYGGSLDAEDLDGYDKDDRHLLKKVTKERVHASTDGLQEYRVEMWPAQVVQLASSGIQGDCGRVAMGIFATEEEDFGDEASGDDSATKTTRRTKRVEPDTPLMLWIPACVLELAQPSVVNEYLDAKEKKLLKKSGTGTGRSRKKAATKEDDGNVNGDGDGQTPKPSKPKPKTVRKKKSAQPMIGEEPLDPKPKKAKGPARRFLSPSDGESTAPDDSESDAAPRGPLFRASSHDPVASSSLGTFNDVFDILSKKPPVISASQPTQRSQPTHRSQPLKPLKPSKPAATERAQLLFTQRPDVEELSDSDEEDELDPYSALSQPKTKTPTRAPSAVLSGSGSSAGSSRQPSRNLTVEPEVASKTPKKQPSSSRLLDAIADLGGETPKARMVRKKSDISSASDMSDWNQKQAGQSSQAVRMPNSPKKRQKMSKVHQNTTYDEDATIVLTDSDDDLPDVLAIAHSRAKPNPKPKAPIRLSQTASKTQKPSVRPSQTRKLMPPYADDEIIDLSD